MYSEKRPTISTTTQLVLNYGHKNCTLYLGNQPPICRFECGRAHFATGKRRYQRLLETPGAVQARSGRQQSLLFTERHRENRGACREKKTLSNM